LLDERIESVEINIGQDRGNNPALRRAGMRGVPGPVLQLSRPQHPADQLQEPLVVDVLAQDREHDLMIEAAERSPVLLPVSRTFLQP
jgi:hypothetical protein